MHIVFGGSFNPPTKAHLHIVETLHKKFKDATILVLPVGDDYKKPELISFFHRKNMLDLLFDQKPYVKVLENEKERAYQGTLYSLNELNTTYKNLYFVIGSDNLMDLFTWIEYKKLLANYPFIIMNRNHYLKKEEAEKIFKDIPHQFEFVEFDMPISSTKVRENIEKSKDLLTKKVHIYIKKHKLYKEQKHV